MNGPRVCHPRILPRDLHVAAAMRSIAHNPANAPEFTNHHGLPDVHPLEIASVTSKRWKPGTNLSVGFLGGSARTRQRVMASLHLISEVCNLDFTQVPDPSSAIIRWSFDPSSGSWHYVGTDSLSIPRDQPTGNLGWIDDTTDDEEVYRVGTHEGLHGVGMLHEAQLGIALHQLIFNESVVYADFGGPPNNWSPATIREQILDGFDLAGVEHSDWDRASLMEYWFRPESFVPPTTIPMTTRMSVSDIAKLREWYGARGVVTPTTPTDLPHYAIGADPIALTFPASGPLRLLLDCAGAGAALLVAVSSQSPLAALAVQVRPPGGSYPIPVPMTGNVGRLVIPGAGTLEVDVTPPPGVSPGSALIFAVVPS